DRRSGEAPAARVSDLHVHVRDRAEADVESARAEAVRQVGAHEGSGRRPEAALLAAAEAGIEGVAEDGRRSSLVASESSRGGEHAANLQSLPRPAARLDLPTGRDDHVLDDRQAEPGAPRGACPVAAIEALEEAGK